MRVPMDSRMYMGAERYIIEARINPTLSRASRAVNLVWDTGSSQNTIGYKDALATQIPTSKLESISDPIRVNLGEGPLKGYEVEVEYNFITESKEKISTKYPALVLCPWSDSNEHKKSAEKAPSIIGKNFIENKKWRPSREWDAMVIPED